MDEVNEKISQIQETSLAIYNGFYCINEIVNSILYCCEYLNRKLYSTNTSGSFSSQTTEIGQTSSSLSSSSTQHLAASANTPKLTKMNSMERMQTDYTKNVIDKMEYIRKILSQLMPVNYRLEILENIYSLIYLSAYDLKEVENNEDSNDENELDLVNEATQNISASKYLDHSNLSKNQGFEIINTSDLVLINQKDEANDDFEFSIYNEANSVYDVNQKEQGNQSSKSTIGSYCSRDSYTSRRYSYSPG